jgi:hypothetical protein
VANLLRGETTREDEDDITHAYTRVRCKGKREDQASGIGINKEKMRARVTIA